MPTAPTFRPGVNIDKVPGSARLIRGVETSVTAFVGRALHGPIDEPITVASWAGFESSFGGLSADCPMAYAVRDFFANGGTRALIVRLVGKNAPVTVMGRRVVRAVPGGGAPLTVDDYIGHEAGKRGLFALEKADLFNLLCIPPDTRDGNVSAAVYRKAADYCYRRRAMLILDPDREWGEGGGGSALDGVKALGLAGAGAKNAMLFFPRIRQPDPERQGRVETFAPCGAVAGVIARSDSRRGVWKASAGAGAALLGVTGLQADLTIADIGTLQSAGINCLRSLPGVGPVVWGARTLRVDDEFRYVPVRRLALFIEESLVRGLTWTVYEPDGEPLREKIRSAAGAFMDGLWRQGAFAGSRPHESYFVKCDRETATPAEGGQGIAVLLVGFAPARPGEFVQLRIPTKTAGGIVSEYEALPDFDASGNPVGIQPITLEQEGWKRDETGDSR